MEDAEIARMHSARGTVARIREKLQNDRCWRQRRRGLVALARWADCIYAQETPLPSRVLRVISGSGRRMIFNFSDPIHLANSPHHRLHHKIRHHLVDLPRFRATLRSAKYAIVENSLLTEVVADHGVQPVVMRGPVDVDVFHPVRQRRESTGITIGWAGSPATLAYLEPLLPLLKHLAEKHPELELTVFGIRQRVEVPGLRVRVVPWTAEGESQEIARFDIGLSVLPVDKWSRYRGGLKLIQYMASGVPVIASPLGIGDQVVEPGVTGYLATEPSEWAQALDLLIRDGALRRKMSHAARDRAVRSYSYTAYLGQMLGLLGVAPHVTTAQA
jgi:glycosyltransferase involved in cell wall biosynthesis